MTAEHIVKAYDEELGQLDNLIAEMGGLAEEQLADAIAALVKRDAEKAERVVARDKQIDRFETEIDEMAVRLLALRQPMAEDLRSIVAALKIANTIERIGDYAKNIAKRTSVLVEAPAIPGTTATLARMAGLAQNMIKTALDAYVTRNAVLAIDVRDRDQEVDHLYTSLFRELLTYMMEDPRSISTCTHLLFIAKNIERVGDHTTSIAEQVHFMVRGRLPEGDRPKGDQTSVAVIEPLPDLDSNTNG